MIRRPGVVPALLAVTGGPEGGRRLLAFPQRHWRLLLHERQQHQLLRGRGRSLGTTAIRRGPGVGTGAAATADDVRAMRERMNDSGQPHDEGDRRTPTEADKWESLWTDGLTPWDLGQPTPSLVHELSQHPHRPLGLVPLTVAGGRGPPTVVEHLRTLVPGCGAGYDLIPLFRHHDDLIASGTVRRATVVGLDLSPTSLSRAAEEVEEALEFCPLERPTHVRLMRGDFFRDLSTWEVVACYGGETADTGDTQAGFRRTSVPSDSRNLAQFDFLYDYTFFCALPPKLRPAWGRRTAELLHPMRGRLLTLMFPVLGRSGGDDGGQRPLRGPPYPVTRKDYREALQPHGFAVDRDPYESPATHPTRLGTELVGWWGRSNDQVHIGLSKL